LSVEREDLEISPRSPVGGATSGGVGTSRTSLFLPAVPGREEAAELLILGMSMRVSLFGKLGLLGFEATAWSMEEGSVSASVPLSSPLLPLSRMRLGGGLILEGLSEAPRRDGVVRETEDEEEGTEGDGGAMDCARRL
jgi:hypothetical protein